MQVKILMTFHSLNTFEIQKLFTNIDEYESTEVHWITFYKNAENVTYFDSFGVKLIPKEIREYCK